MRPFPFIFLFFFIFISCSSDNENLADDIPLTFTVKYEILGNGELPQINYTANEGSDTIDRDEGEPVWDVSGVKLPFIKEVQYTKKGDGEAGGGGATIHGCARFSISAYANRNKGQISEMNIYINGQLKDSKKEGYYYIPGTHWTPWGSASFQYLRIGSDPNQFTCN
jgi:hypothetical protein